MEFWHLTALVPGDSPLPEPPPLHCNGEGAPGGLNRSHAGIAMRRRSPTPSPSAARTSPPPLPLARERGAVASGVTHVGLTVALV